MQFTKYLAASALLCFTTLLNAQNIQLNRLQKDITYLASDKLKGRGTGTKEELKAAKYLAKQMKKAGLKPMGDTGTYFAKFGFKKSKTDIHGGHIADGAQVYSQNVVGMLDNGAEYTVIIGGHYDHLGLGHDDNSLDSEPHGKIHNGADDNASGTAGVIELARVLSNNGIKEQYNYLFMCFSGEELGLVGSKRYSDYPTIDLKKVNYMVNMDMIGRLTPEKGLVVGGVGTSPDFVPMINSTPFVHKIKQDSAGVGPSDHTSFYLKNIPVLFFFTGQHSDYHKPSDDVEFIQLEGVGKVLSYVQKIMMQLDAKPRLVFQETKANQSDSPKFTVTLGIMPDYTYEGIGVNIDAVREGKPAATAGILKQDVIKRLGDMEVSDVNTYMKALATFKKGDKTSVTIQRGTETKVFQIEF
jgi:Peptidase family M28/PDZ domain